MPPLIREENYQNMNESPSDSTTAKITEKVTGALEKLVDIRALTLGMSFVMYLDIWLISEGIDPYQVSIDDAFKNIKSLSIGKIGTFIISYSLLMTSMLPALRWLYITTLDTIAPSGYIAKEPTLEERQLSIWSLGFVLFSLSDLIYGFFGKTAYQGMIITAIKQLTEDGFITGIFRLALLIFFLICFKEAIER